MPINRRQFLRLAALGATAAVTGCAVVEPAAPRLPKFVVDYDSEGRVIWARLPEEDGVLDMVRVAYWYESDEDILRENARLRRTFLQDYSDEYA